jgi:hypothetical protein
MPGSKASKTNAKRWSAASAVAKATRRFSASEYAQEGDHEMYSFEALGARQGLRRERLIKLGLQRPADLWGLPGENAG